MTDPASHYRRTKEELIEQLRDQMAMLTELAEKFDAGVEMWAMPMSTIVRNLVVDRGKTNKSVLTQLKMKDRLGYLDTVGPINTESDGPISGLFVIELNPQEAFMRHAPLFRSTHETPTRYRTFDQWWLDKVTKDYRGSLFSREDFIVHVANQDGGTHVQATLPQRYAAISREDSFGMSIEISDGRTAATGNPMLPGVRQIAYELEMTIRKQLAHWVGPPATSSSDA